MAISHVVSGPVSTGSFLWGVAIYILYPLQYERFDERRPNDVLACVIGFVKYGSRCWIFFLKYICFSVFYVEPWTRHIRFSCIASISNISKFYSVFVTFVYTTNYHEKLFCWVVRYILVIIIYVINYKRNKV